MKVSTFEACRFALALCLPAACLQASAATMSVSVMGEVSDVSGSAPSGFPVEEGDDFELSLGVDPSAPDLDPSGEGLYALDSFRLTLGDFVYETTTGVGLKVKQAGSGNYRIEFVSNGGSMPELGTPATPDPASGLMLKVPDGEFLRIFLVGYPFTSDALPLDELAASAGSLSSGVFAAWFVAGDEQADVRFRPRVLATTIPEPLSAALLASAATVSLCVSRRR